VEAQNKNFDRKIVKKRFRKKVVADKKVKAVIRQRTGRTSKEKRRLLRKKKQLKNRGDLTGGSYYYSISKIVGN
jgi:hypothetical protein